MCSLKYMLITIPRNRQISGIALLVIVHGLVPDQRDDVLGQDAIDKGVRLVPAPVELGWCVAGGVDLAPQLGFEGKQ